MWVRGKGGGSAICVAAIVAFKRADVPSLYTNVYIKLRRGGGARAQKKEPPRQIVMDEAGVPIQHRIVQCAHQKKAGG